MPTPWPMAALDFEASTLGPQSYPIEVGVAVWKGPRHPIGTWSSLIRPTPAWTHDGLWTAEAQALHGISPGDLAGTPEPRTVMIMLNSALRGFGQVACDGGKHDEFWLARLADAADLDPTFRLAGTTTLERGLDDDGLERAAAWRSAHADEHRAGPDALQHLLAIAAAHGMEPTLVPVGMSDVRTRRA